MSQASPLAPGRPLPAGRPARAGQGAPAPDGRGHLRAVAPRRAGVVPALLWLMLAGGAVAARATAHQSAWLDAWLASTGVLAALQAGRGRRSRANGGLAALVVGCVAASAAGGLIGAAAVTGGVLLLALLWQRVAPPDAGISPVSSAALGVACAAPAAGATITARAGWGPVLAMLVLVAAYDLGAFVVGEGAAGRWEGPTAGVVAMVPVSLVVAAIVTPDGVGPWLLCGLTACVAPAGAWAAAALARGRRCPALARLDTLILVAPAWALLAPRLLGLGGA